jgi:hypothetical protein
LFDQNRHHQRIERHGACGAGGFGDMAFGITEQPVEHLAVFFAQCAAEISPSGEFFL